MTFKLNAAMVERAIVLVRDSWRGPLGQVALSDEKTMCFLKARVGADCSGSGLVMSTCGCSQLLCQQCVFWDVDKMGSVDFLMNWDY